MVLFNTRPHGSIKPSLGTGSISVAPPRDGSSSLAPGDATHPKKGPCKSRRHGTGDGVGKRPADATRAHHEDDEGPRPGTPSAVEIWEFANFPFSVDHLVAEDGSCTKSVIRNN